MKTHPKPRIPLIPLGLYIHFPGCVKKCPYCDFNSHPLKSPLDEEAYIHRLLEDFRCDRNTLSERLADRELHSVFLGGGTPSLFSATAISTLLGGIRDLSDLSEGLEITLEANPGTFEQEKFLGYREAGVNRLSIGVQSFENAKLAALGRIHSAEESLLAIQAARLAGFGNINLDLMYGLPGQSPDEALADLRCAIGQQPEHISWYQLTLEPKTVFAARPPVLPVENQLLEIEERGLTLLADHGYQRYEISAFARPDRNCRHNLNYWRFGDYLGIGAGAHGKISDARNQSLVRTAKPSQPRNYLKGSADDLRSETSIPLQDVASEFMLNALRLVDGVDESLFHWRTFQSLTVIEAPLKRMRALDLMEAGRLALSARGLRYLDSVVSEFLPLYSGTNHTAS